MDSNSTEPVGRVGNDTPTNLGKPTSPYPGLRPFLADEASIFFGRRQHWQAILERLSKAHFVPVLGPSGSGKSSLVRAGVIPALKAGRLYAAGSSWRIAVMRPDDSPLWNMATTIAELLSNLRQSHLEASPGSDIPELSIEDVLSLMHVEPDIGQKNLRAAAIERGLKENDNILLVIDQFEELFSSDNRQHGSEVEYLIELIRQTTLAEIPGFYLIMTMRTDNLRDCARYPDLAGAINESFYLTHNLTPAEIRLAIEQPTHAHKEFAADFEPGLVDIICRDMAREGDDQLPLMQHILRRMWNEAAEATRSGETPQLTMDLYRKFGGISQAINQNAEELAGNLSSSQQQLLPTFFRSIVEPRGHGSADAVRRLRKISDIVSVAGLKSPQQVNDLKAIVDQFRHDNALFLWPRYKQVQELQDDTRVDLVHECIIRKWQAFSNWVENEADAARRLRELVADSKRKDKGGNTPLLGRSGTHTYSVWRRDNRVNPRWAAQYGISSAEFKNAISFHEKCIADVEKKERESRLKDLSVARNRFRSLSAFTLSALLAVGIIAFYFYNQQSIDLAKKESELREQSERQTLQFFFESLARQSKVISDYEKRLGDIRTSFQIDVSNPSATKLEIFLRSLRIFNIAKQLTLLRANMDTQMREMTQSIDILFRNKDDFFTMEEGKRREFSRRTNSLRVGVNSLDQELKSELQREILRLGEHGPLYLSGYHKNPYLSYVPNSPDRKIVSAAYSHQLNRIMIVHSDSAVEGPFLDIGFFANKDSKSQDFNYDSEAGHIRKSDDTEFKLQTRAMRSRTIWNLQEVSTADAAQEREGNIKRYQLTNNKNQETRTLMFPARWQISEGVTGHVAFADGDTHAAMYYQPSPAPTDALGNSLGSIIIFEVFPWIDGVALGVAPVAEIISRHEIQHVQFLNDERFLAVSTADDQTWIAVWQTEDLIEEARRRHLLGSSNN